MLNCLKKGSILYFILEISTMIITIVVLLGDKNEAQLRNLKINNQKHWAIETYFTWCNIRTNNHLSLTKSKINHF